MPRYPAPPPSPRRAALGPSPPPPPPLKGYHLPPKVEFCWVRLANLLLFAQGLNRPTIPRKPHQQGRKPTARPPPQSRHPSILLRHSPYPWTDVLLLLMANDKQRDPLDQNKAGPPTPVSHQLTPGGECFHSQVLPGRHTQEEAIYWDQLPESRIAVNCPCQTHPKSPADSHQGRSTEASILRCDRAAPQNRTEQLLLRRALREPLQSTPRDPVVISPPALLQVG